jgi:hypothetical protein
MSLNLKIKIMKTIKLYHVGCTLLFNNDEEIIDYAPKNDELFYFQENIEKAIEIYEGINPFQFDKKEILRARLNGFGNTYNKYILVVEMPLKLYNSCSFEDEGEKCTEEKRIEYINEMVWHEDVKWKFDNLKETVFDIDWIGMEFKNFRNYEPLTA